MSKNKIIYLFILPILAIILIVLATFRPVGIDADSLSYLNAYNSLSEGKVLIAEPTFNLFSMLSYTIFGAAGLPFLFFIYAGLSVSIKFLAIYRYSTSILLSIIIYLCMFYILHDLTQIRVGLASAFFLLALPDLINENKKHYIFKIVIACLCHLSAAVLLPLVFLSPRKINYKLVLLAPIVMLVVVLAIHDMSSILIAMFKYFPEPFSSKAISYIIGVQQYGRFDSVNVFSKFTLSSFVFFVAYLITTYKTKNINQSDIIYLKLFSIMLTFFYLFSSIPVLASRVFELFAVSFIFSFPAMITKFKPSWGAGLLITVWMCLYLYIVNLKLIGV